VSVTKKMKMKGPSSIGHPAHNDGADLL